MARVLAEPLDWAEAVFHVLAHLARTRDFPSTVFDASYVAHARRALGPIEARCLGNDVPVLETLATSHETLAWLGWLARLHPDAATARRAETLPLEAIEDASLVDSTVLECLLGGVPAQAEVLRCAALLELTPLLSWPVTGLRQAAARLEAELVGLESLAPELGEVTIRMVRSLGWRGRAWDGRIWVGVPGGPTGPSVMHAAWQVAHEATVLEVGRRIRREEGASTAERELEQASVALLARRASRRRLGDEHAAWLARFDERTRAWVSAELLGPEWTDRIERWTGTDSPD